MWNFAFFFNSILLGAGLAMDAFSVSLADGLNEHNMKMRKSVYISLVFGIFQAIMPFIGWVAVNTVAQYFTWFEKLIPWIALVLLLFIGGKMIIEGVKKKEEEEESGPLKAGTILVQGIATSIDALSVGFTVAQYTWVMTLVCCCIIAAITFALCLMGIFIGKKFGTKLSNKAEIIGGIILIIIGIEIFVTGII